MEDVLIIVNPVSGGGRTGRRWAAVADRIREAGLRFDCALTTRPGEATELARTAVRESRPVVAAAGGDGTLNEVVNGFFADGDPIPTSTALGHVPLGTGSDFRRTFGFECDPARIAAGLGGDDRRRIDAGRATYAAHDGSRGVRHFINIADAGIGGEVVDRVNRSSKPLGGDLTFLLASLGALLTWKNRVMRVVVDGETTELTAQQVVIANCQYFGSGMRIAPQASPDDGLFDVLMVGDVTMMENLRGLSRIRAGRHVEDDNPKLHITRGRRIEVDSPAVVRVDLDGEQPGLLPAVFEVMPGVIDLVAPKAGLTEVVVD